MLTAGYMMHSWLLRPEWKDDVTYISSAGDVAPLDAPMVLPGGASYRVKFLDGSEHPLQQGRCR